MRRSDSYYIYSYTLRIKRKEIGKTKRKIRTKASKRERRKKEIQIHRKIEENKKLVKIPTSKSKVGK